MVLTDSSLNAPGPIDLFLGADIYASVISDSLIKTQPVTPNKKLGWIVFCKVPNITEITHTVSSYVSLTDLDGQLNDFWEIDASNIIGSSHEICEEYF